MNSLPLLAGLLLLAACGGTATAPVRKEAPGKGPEALAGYLERNPGAFHTFVCRTGTKATSWSAPGFSTDGPQPLFSVTKSVVGLLFGIAMEEGRLRPDDPLCKYFPAFTNAREDQARRSRVTLRHLLTMTSGLNRDEDRVPAPIRSSRLDRVLSLPLGNEPGAEFCYHNGAVHLLGAVIAEATGQPLEAYADEKLFRPLGIGEWRWDRDFDGRATGDTGLRLTPNSLARIGEMLLEGGTWKGRKIVPPQWIRQSTATQVKGWNYGYLWWVNPFGGYRAQGRHGQYLFVLPANRSVAVFTGGLDDEDIGLPYMLAMKYLR